MTFDMKTMRNSQKDYSKIYRAAKFVFQKLGGGFILYKSSVLTGNDCLIERWILTKVNTAAQQMSLEESEFARPTLLSQRYLDLELFNLFIYNSKSIILDGMATETHSAMVTLYTTIELIDAAKAPLSKVQNKDFTDAMQWTKSPKRDVEGSLRELQETITIFEKMKVKAGIYVSRYGWYKPRWLWGGGIMNALNTTITNRVYCYLFLSVC